MKKIVFLLAMCFMLSAYSQLNAQKSAPTTITSSGTKLPNPTGHAGQFLSTNGTGFNWLAIPTPTYATGISAALTGSGTVGYVPVYSSSNTFTNSIIQQDALNNILINSSFSNAQLNVKTSVLPSFKNAIYGDGSASSGYGVYGIGTYGVVGYTDNDAYGRAIYGNATSLPYTGIGGVFEGGRTAVFCRSSTNDVNSNILTLSDNSFNTKFNVLGNGNVGIGIGVPTSLLHIKESTGYNQLRLETSYTPTGTADTNGNNGDFAWDNNFIYIKTSVGWKRTAISIF